MSLVCPLAGKIFSANNLSLWYWTSKLSMVIQIKVKSMLSGGKVGKYLGGKNCIIQGSAASISMKNSFILYQIIAVE